MVKAEENLLLYLAKAIFFPEGDTWILNQSQLRTLQPVILRQHLRIVLVKLGTITILPGVLSQKCTKPSCSR